MSWPPPFALGKNRSISPDSVERYLVGTFGDAPDDARAAMMELARSLPHTELAEEAYHLHEEFRPKIPAGERGRGAIGGLDLGRIRAQKS